MPANKLEELGMALTLEDAGSRALSSQLRARVFKLWPLYGLFASYGPTPPGLLAS